MAGQSMGHSAILVRFGSQLASFVADPCPDHAEVQFGLLSALQDELETGFALVGHSILIVTLQNPLLLNGKHRAEVHSLQAAPLRPGVHPAAGRTLSGHNEGSMILRILVFVLILTQAMTYRDR